MVSIDLNYNILLYYLKILSIEGEKNMKRKLIGIFVCMLLIATVVPMSTILAEKIEYSGNPLDKGWKWIASYPNYAPSGMPDFDQIQGQWMGIIDGGNGIAESSAGGDDVQVTIVGALVDPDEPAVVAPGQNCELESFANGDDIEVWMFSNAVSTMNCFWWLDSKYGDPDGYPGDGEDIYPLVQDYGAGDDHIAENAPLSIEKMANALDITSTIYLDDDVWVDTIDAWLLNVSLEEALNVNFYTYPTFEFISDEIESNNAVILVINFIDDTSGDCVVVGSHYVACTGVNFDDSKIAFCDPFLNKYNPSDDDHNDTQYVSQDRYVVEIGSPCENMPDIEFWIPTYLADDYNFSVIKSALVIEYINNPPGTPTIDGPTSGNIGTAYTYTFNSIDPDSDDVFFYIEWGDGYVETWDGPHASGTDIDIDHTYTLEGTFTIQAKAKDPSGDESGIAELEVTMPRNKQSNFNLLYWLFECFPNTFQLLQHVLGLH